MEIKIEPKAGIRNVLLITNEVMENSTLHGIEYLINRKEAETMDAAKMQYPGHSYQINRHFEPYAGGCKVIIDCSIYEGVQRWIF